MGSDSFHLAFARGWHQSAYFDCSWEFGSPVGEGISGSRFVYGPGKERCFAKPAFDSAGVANAAHEKIAADLASLIGVPVPPVTLLVPSGHTELCCVSASAFRQPITWQQSFGMRSDLFNVNVLPLLAMGRVFHTWIDDRDHMSHGGNIVVDAESTADAPKIAFIDHAYSMSRYWPHELGTCWPVSPYYVPAESLPEPVTQLTIDKILNIDAGQIVSILERIPEVYLPATLKDVVLRGLRDRMKTLEAAFGVRRR